MFGSVIPFTHNALELVGIEATKILIYVLITSDAFILLTLELSIDG